MKVHMFGDNLGPPKMSKTKIHILTISEPISMKPAIVLVHVVIECLLTANGSLSMGAEKQKKICQIKVLRYLHSALPLH